MASYNKFQPFVAALAHKQHDLANDQLVIALTNSAPSAANGVLADISEISNYANCSTREIITISSGQTSGTYKLILTDRTLTATGAVGPFRYVVIYNDTHASDGLIGWYDYGSSVELASGESFLVDFDGTDGLFTLA